MPQQVFVPPPPLSVVAAFFKFVVTAVISIYYLESILAVEVQH